jgi:hypothetical protein
VVIHRGREAASVLDLHCAFGGRSPVFSQTPV